jgi:hypothetical protein
MISGIIAWIVRLEKAFGEPAAELPIQASTAKARVSLIASLHRGEKLG